MSKRNVRLWSQDYTQVLCESTDLDEVKQYFATSDLDWCGLTVHRGGDDRRPIWSGRILRGIGGAELHEERQYLDSRQPLAAAV